MKTEPINAYLYSRVSRGTQTKGAGLTRQDQRGVAICKANGWILQPDTLSDVGSAYTGSNILKGNLGRFIEAAKQGRLKPNPVLILEQWDRFSRQDLDTSFDEARNLLKAGVAIHIGFAGGKTFTQEDLNDLSSRISMEVSMRQAYEYSHNLSKRVNDAFQRKYQQALDGKPIQLGYWQPAWIDFVGERRTVGKFILNKTAETIRGIVDDYLNGKSMMDVAHRLNAAKVPCIGRKTKRGKRWTQGQVAYLLKTETLVGTIEINGHKFDHYYPPILTDKEWTLLQSKLDDNKNKKGGPRTGEWISNLFPNRVKCACCGGPVTTQNGRCGKMVQRYYKCLESRMNPDKCQVRNMLSIHRIEEDFFLLFLKQNPIELLGRNSTEHQINLAKITVKIKEVEKEFEDVSELVGKFPVKALEKKFSEIQFRLDTLNKAKQGALKQIMSINNAPEHFINIKKALTTLNENDDFAAAVDQMEKALQNPEIRKKIVQLLPSIVDHITVDLVKGEYSITTKDGNTSDFRSVVEVPTV